MGIINALSDYGSGASMDSMSSWSSRDPPVWSSANDPAVTRAEKRPRSSSYLDLIGGTTSTWDARQEFKANGTDCSYVEDERQQQATTTGLTGFGGRFRALRQTSCPERIPETTTRPVSWLPSPSAKEFVPQITTQDQTDNFYQKFFQSPKYEYESEYKKDNYTNYESDYKKDYYTNYMNNQDALDAQINNFQFPALDDRFPPQMPKNDLEPMEIDCKMQPAFIPDLLVPLATSTPVENYSYSTPVVAPRAIRGADRQNVGKTPAPIAETSADITSEQLRVLSSLPDAAVEGLLRQLRAARDLPTAPTVHHEKQRKSDQHCRFCKNNGERESWYLSHALKDEKGRVSCPVLQAYVCPRCGASGPKAHTAKYCPMASSEERIRSAAMMRSVRMASNRRRALYQQSNLQYNYSSNLPYDRSSNQSSNPYDCEYVMFGDAPAGRLPPLDPSWIELEKKLSGWISS